MSPTNFSLPTEEHVTPGHLACQGCGGALAMRYTLKALGSKTVIVMPACCWTVIAGPFPYSAVKMPVVHTAFETAAVTAAGVRAGLDAKGEHDCTVMAWAGDGGTFDIGLQALSACAERNENILYVCYDNEAYMNTGIQRSSATPTGAWTTTTPEKKHAKKKDIMQVMAAHRIPYAATASIAYPDDLIRKVEKAKRTTGMRFLHIISPCPTGWKTSPEMTVELARLAVESNIFPLYEIEDGSRYTLSQVQNPISVEVYLKKQGRFGHMSDEEMSHLQESVDLRMRHLQRLAGPLPD